MSGQLDGKEKFSGGRGKQEDTKQLQNHVWRFVNVDDQAAIVRARAAPLQDLWAWYDGR